MSLASVPALWLLVALVLLLLAAAVVAVRLLLPAMGESSGRELRNCSARRRMLGPGERDGEVKPERGDDRGERPEEAE